MSVPLIEESPGAFTASSAEHRQPAGRARRRDRRRVRQADPSVSFEMADGTVVTFGTDAIMLYLAVIQTTLLIYLAVVES